MAAVLAVVLGLASPGAGGLGAAWAAQNSHDGENNGETDQDGEGASGDAVTGQVLGGVNAGSTSVDAENHSEDVDARSGDADGTNSSDSLTGLEADETSVAETTATSDTDDSLALAFTDADAVAVNDHDGDNDFSLSQTASASSGDAVAGEVIGAVVSAGGSADVVAANRSEDVDARSGDVAAVNLSEAITGMRADADAFAFADAASQREIVDTGTTPPVIDPLVEGGQSQGANASAVAAAIAVNTQTNDNAASLSQSAVSGSGDAVGGQVIGLVSAGDSSVDARNTSTDADIRTGDAASVNFAHLETGLIASADALSASSGTSDALITSSASGAAAPAFDLHVAATPTSAAEAVAANAHDGENTSSVSQDAIADSGDGVGGQVIGAVTSAGGSADIVAENTSDDVDAETGDVTAVNEAFAFTGPFAEANSTATADALASFEGFAESTDTSTVEGRGVVAAVSEVTATSVAANEQTDDNDLTSAQLSDAASGDAVAGQVIGTVAAGDVSVDASNESTDVDAGTGDAEAANTTSAIAGNTAVSDAVGDALDEAAGSMSGTASGGSSTSATVVVGVPDPFVTVPFGAEAIAGSLALEGQDGENTLSSDQQATASSGDAVGGQVIGAVTSVGGSADIVAANTSEDVDAATGDADSANGSVATAGSFATGFAGADATSASRGDAIGTAEDGGEVTQEVLAAALASSLAQGLAVTSQEGDNDLAVDQSADAVSGDGVGGQVIGVVSAGDTSVDARNASRDVDVESGEAAAGNAGQFQAGLDSTSAALSDGTAAATASSSGTATEGATVDLGAASLLGALSLSDALAANLQFDDNDLAADSSASAASGDAVGGQVVGAVTSAAGSADIVAENTSDDVDVETGAAEAANAATATAGSDALAVGQAAAVATGTAESTGIATAGSLVDGGAVILGVIPTVAFADAFASNVQDGENNLDVTQSADASTGDGVGGQVIGAVSAGATTIDASNDSEDVDITTGDASSSNDVDVRVGLEADSAGTAAAVSSGTAIAFGASSGGGFVEPLALVFVAAFSDADIAADSLQSDDNDASVGQSSTATSGDGVGGQVIGSVTSGGGSADIVAANRSEDVGIETGNSDAANTATATVGLHAEADGTASSLAEAVAVASGTGEEGETFDVDALTFVIVDAEADAGADNFQDGENELGLDQMAAAATGDGVGGQVIGVVSAGSTSIDASNTAEDVDIETGSAEAGNAAGAFVGLEAIAGSVASAVASGSATASSTGVPIEVIAVTDTAISATATATNVQVDDNTSFVTQDALAASGDGVAGQVVGQVTPAGGTADLVLSNLSENADVRTGNPTFANTDDGFVGLGVSGTQAASVFAVVFGVENEILTG